MAESEGRNTVYDTEVGRLGTPTLIGCDLLDRDAEYLGSCSSMDILSLSESFLHMLIAREMRQQTQFDLAVVGTQEQASRIGYHRLADQFAPLGTYRQVLQVGIRRAESSGSRDGLVVGRVDASGGGVDEGRQGIDIG